LVVGTPTAALVVVGSTVAVVGASPLVIVRSELCNGPAMPNGRCRMHGGASTGPPTPEGLQRIVKARTVHRGYGAEMRELRRLMRALRDEQRHVLELVK
jgi:hypothetical protein